MGGWENMKTWEKVLTRTDGARKCSRESSDVVNRCQPYANRFVPAKKMSQMEVLDIVAPHEAVKKALKHKIHFADSLCWCYVIIATRQASQNKIPSLTRFSPFFKSLRDSTECDFCRHVCFHEFIHIPRRWNIRLAFLCPLLHIYHWKTMWRVHSGISRVVNYEHTQINSLSIVNK